MGGKDRFGVQAPGTLQGSERRQSRRQRWCSSSRQSGGRPGLRFPGSKQKSPSPRNVARPVAPCEAPGKFRLPQGTGRKEPPAIAARVDSQAQVCGAFQVTGCTTNTSTNLSPAQRAQSISQHSPQAAGEPPPPRHTGSDRGRQVKGFAQEKSHRATNRAADALPPKARPHLLANSSRFPTSPRQLRKKVVVQCVSSLPQEGSFGCKEPARMCQGSQKLLLTSSPGILCFKILLPSRAATGTAQAFTSGFTKPHWRRGV